MGYRIETRTFEELNRKLKLPNFQRALVWSSNQKQDFFDTLKNGLPFGSILLYEYEGENEYSLIDGLQRFSTMRDFSENPTDYIDFLDYAEKIADLHINASSSTRSEVIQHAKSCILNIIKKYIDRNTKNPKALELAEKLEERFPILSESTVRDEIIQIQADVLEYFNNQLNISKVKIPCIFFEGEETELAEVFQRLNSGGKKLSKYQVFAAHWDKYDITLGEGSNSTKILENVIERYETLNDNRGILIDEFDPKEMRESRTVNLSELCFGLGKLIAEELKSFINKPTEDIYNEFGFQTMVIVFNIPINRMNTLPTKHKFLKNKLEDLIEKILSTYRIVNNKFSESFSMVVYSRDQKFETKSFTRLQIMSFFSSLWISSYELELNENTDRFTIKPKSQKKRNQKAILNNIVVHAIYDVIRKYWSGTGDKKLMDIYINKNNKYLTPLSKEIFRNELLRWNEESVHKKSINIQSDEKMILTYLANHFRIFYSSLNDNLDYEHIFSRKLYKIHKDNASIPAGALGNIMLLDEDINRSKKESHLYELLNNNISIEKAKITNDHIKYSFYPEKRKLDDI
ncbi:DUF262 domain-containing protein, partial [Staphylococcus pseudintermedius]|nr:DUF262 domain-containing protein [Staphylococcus pseudintermedius]